jgi:hypothetical protein
MSGDAVQFNSTLLPTNWYTFAGINLVPTMCLQGLSDLY